MAEMSFKFYAEIFSVQAFKGWFMHSLQPVSSKSKAITS